MYVYYSYEILGLGSLNLNVLLRYLLAHRATSLLCVGSSQIPDQKLSTELRITIKSCDRAASNKLTIPF